MEADGQWMPNKKIFSLEYGGNIFFHPVYAPPMSKWLIASIRLHNTSELCIFTIGKEGVIVKSESQSSADLKDESSLKNATPDTSVHSRNDFENVKSKTALKNSSPILAKKASSGIKAKAGSSTSTENVSQSKSQVSIHHFSVIQENEVETFLLKVSFNQILEVILPSDSDKNNVSFIVNPGCNQPLVLHLFRHKDSAVVAEVGQTLNRFLSWREDPSSSSAQPVIRNVKLEDLDSIRFEVLLLGKVQVNHDIPPDVVIDEAVEKYISLQRNAFLAKQKEESNQLLQKDNSPEDEKFDSTHPKVNLDKSMNEKSSEVPDHKILDENEFYLQMSFDKNKTKIFQVGKHSITLIAPDPSMRNMEIPFNSIRFCFKGQKCKDHFGIFLKDFASHRKPTREENRPRCFVFKCTETAVCNEIIQAIKQACSVSSHGPDPLLGYHSLCRRIRSMSDDTEKKLPEAGIELAAKYITDFFTDSEQKLVKQKIEEGCRKYLPKSIYEHLVIVMEVIRGIYEERQYAHDLKIKQIAEAANASSSGSQTPGRLTTLKDKARQSFGGLEFLWEKYSQFTGSPTSNPGSKRPSDAFSHSRKDSDGSSILINQRKSLEPTSSVHSLRRSNSSFAPSLNISHAYQASKKYAWLGDQDDRLDSADESIASHRLRVSTLDRDRLKSSDEKSLYDSLSIASGVTSRGRSGIPSAIEADIFAFEKNMPKKRLTAHQRIFASVGSVSCKSAEDAMPLNLKDFKRTKSYLKSPDDFRAAWKRAIDNQISLIRIQRLSEKVPPILKDTAAKNSHSSVKTDEDMIEVWSELLLSINEKIDRDVLHAAVKTEVPPSMRGRIWRFLFEQWKLHNSFYPTSSRGTIKIPDIAYDRLLKNLTIHQHAILIDLGRTFPTHPYFSQQLGNGQLALFNLLKAYSLVDKAVGYCQGLSFVAGILLINLNNANDSYYLLCRMMADMNYRKFYLPDMVALRVAVYKLTRLLNDFHGDLFNHFETNDVSLMLFSTPWFLTMFASVLSLDFTTRIFDLFFLEGPGAIFKTALCLLDCHKENLMKEQGFENIVNYFKSALPNMDDQQIKKVTKEMFDLNIGNRLLMYDAEYKLLEELNEENVDEKLVAFLKDTEKKCNHLRKSIRIAEKENVDLADELKAANRQIESLRKGLSEFARMDEQRRIHYDQLRKENDHLKKLQAR